MNQDDASGQPAEHAITRYEVNPVGWVESRLQALADAPRQGDEGAPDAWLRFDAQVDAALADIAPGDELFLLTWLHRADRGVLSVHPQDDPNTPLTGVFSTRSPDRPNPIGLHIVRVLEVDRSRVHVSPLEAVDGTPIIDVKPTLKG